MRIEINRDVCESNGYCESVAPDVFRINDEDTLVVLIGEVDPASDPERFASVETAARMCPKQAISLGFAEPPTSSSG